MERKLRENEDLWRLFEAIAELENGSEAALFFRDLCTLGELEALAERWKVAQMIDEGIPYRRINQLTGASTATVTRIAHWLHNGEGGYRLLLDRLRTRRARGPGSV
ncbi:MAG: YerC/YecD family TrpR-related protein [Acidobacteriota bacterium]|jgi:TrpR-related protein YerC/YecD